MDQSQGGGFLQYNPWKEIFVFALVMFAGLLVAQAFGWGVASFLGIDLTATSLQDLTEESGNEISLLLFQMTYAITLFIIAPLFFLKVVRSNMPSVSFFGGEATGKLLGITFLIVLCYLPISALLVEWNAGVELPKALSELERAMKAQEDELQRLTMYMLDFQSTGHFLLAIFVIAVVPGIGEELVFRGVLQRYMVDISRNHHLGIWLTGFFFSVFHMQFYGLLPRWLLGVLFGYLYHWSGRLSVPMLAHFLNNGLTLVLAYWLHSQGKTIADLESMGGELSWWMPLLALAALIGLVQRFKRTQAVEE